MKILSVGDKTLDEALGGGFLEDTVMLLIYDSYSLGWLLSFHIMKERIKDGDFGLFMNYNLPVSRLGLRMRLLGIDMEAEGKKGNLAIVDFFGSRYGIRYDLDYVYQVENFDAQTYIPKFLQVYSRIIKEKIGDKRAVGVNFTTDGMAFEIGEDTIIRILRSNLAHKEQAYLTSAPERKRPVNILNVNKDRVSQRFIAWLTELSEYVIEFSSKPEGKPFGEEAMNVIKSPLEAFEPATYAFSIKHGRIVIHKE